MLKSFTADRPRHVSIAVRSSKRIPDCETFEIVRFLIDNSNIDPVEVPVEKRIPRILHLRSRSNYDLNSA